MSFTEFLKSAKDLLKAPPETLSPEKTLYIKRVLTGQITEEDETRYKGDVLEKAASQPPPSFFGFSTESLGSLTIIATQKKLEELSEEQLHEEMKRHAQEESRRFGLNLASPEPPQAK